MRTSVTRGHKGGLLLALVAVVAGVILIVVAAAVQKSAPQPPRDAGRIDAGSSSAAPSPSAAGTVSTGRATLPASRPVRISIPAIGVHSQVLPIGLAPDGTLAVPQPGPDQDKAAWFKDSPTPGQPGPSVIEGHVDSQQGPSVFFQLGRIRPGNKIQVDRADGVVVEFTVNAVRDFPKSSFPTRLVYGAPDLSKPLLRLITCSDYNKALRHHTGNEVVFAHLTAVRHRH